VRWYGLAYVIGFIIAYWWLRRASTTIKNLDKEQVDTLILYLIGGVIIGGRVLQFVFYRPHMIWHDPLEIIRIWNGGMSFHGGLIGAIIAMWLFSKKNKVSFLALGDVIVIPASLALVIGRIANFINSELVGTITNVPWCVNFPNAPNPAHRIGCRHPSQLYEALKNTAIFIILTTQKNTKEGTRTFLFITLYGFLRFIINFYRDEPALIIGISTGQLLSLIMGIGGLILLIANNKREKQRQRTTPRRKKTFRTTKK